MINVVKIYRNNPAYPSTLKKYLADSVPKGLSVIGNFSILQGKSLAIFSWMSIASRIQRD